MQSWIGAMNVCDGSVHYGEDSKESTSVCVSSGVVLVEQ